MSSKLIFLLTIPVLLLAACQPAASAPAEPQPTPQIITLSHPSELRWLGPSFNACAAETTVSVLIVDETDTPDAALYWGEPLNAPGELFQLGEETLVLVTHPDNPATGLSLSEAQRMFSGAMNSWPNGDELTVYVLPAGNPVHEVLESALGTGIPRSVDIQVAPSLEAMQQYVADEPGALGVLPQGWLNNEVKSLSWEGQALQPILGSFSGERAEAFVRCLQRVVVEKTKQ